jgi:hypothetical protein
LATDLVEGLGGPLDYVERVGALHRCRATLSDDLGDPVGLIGRDVGNQRAPLGAEQLEERSQRRPVPTGRGPQQPARIVIDDDSEVTVPALVGDLIDSDAPQPVQTVTEGLDISPDPGDDRPDRAPGDPQQLCHRGLRTLRHQPGDSLIEGDRVPRTVARPRHMSDHDAVLATRHPRGVGLHERLHHAQVQRPPSASTLAAVIARAAPLTDAAPPPSAPGDPHVNEEYLVVLNELHVLNDCLLDR